jgi:hypothetical protein
MDSSKGGLNCPRLSVARPVRLMISILNLRRPSKFHRMNSRQSTVAIDSIDRYHSLKNIACTVLASLVTDDFELIPGEVGNPRVVVPLSSPYDPEVETSWTFVERILASCTLARDW